MDKKKHKNTLGGKNMEILLLKNAVITASVGLQLVAFTINMFMK
jgi:hypothetical protein